MTAAPTGAWEPLSRIGFRSRLTLSLVSLGWVGGYGIYVGSSFISQALNLLLGGNVATRIIWLVGALIVVSVATVLIHAARNPIPSVNFAAGLIRVGSGSREIPLEAINRCVLTPTSKGKSRGLLLRFRVDKKNVRFGVFLRSADRVLLDDEQKARLVRVVRGSSIAMPSSPYDPKGSFARYNFPGNVDADTAIELIQDPPAPGDPLPIVEGAPS